MSQAIKLNVKMSLFSSLPGWFATIAAMILLTVGLWNANATLSEKGFYAMAFCLSMFAAIAVQKNTRDAKLLEDKEL